MRKHGSFWQAAPVLVFLSIFVWTTFALAASLHLRTTTDKEIYGLGSEVNWTIWAWASTGDNRGVSSINVNLNDNRSEELYPAIRVGEPPYYEFLDTYYGLSEGFIASSPGSPRAIAPRLRFIDASQITQIYDIGNDGEEHIFAKGSYTVTKLGPHDLNITLNPSLYWVNGSEMDEFTPGDNFPAQFNVVFYADVDSDMYINLGDLGRLGNNWLVTDCNTVNDWCRRADINRSGEVDPNDISFMAAQWLWCSNPDDPDCDQYLPGDI